MTIGKVLTHIEDQTGLGLAACDHFNAVYDHRGAKYFNVSLPSRVSESLAYSQLERLAYYSPIVTKVEPNGINRLAVYFNEETS